MLSIKDLNLEELKPKEIKKVMGLIETTEDYLVEIALRQKFLTMCEIVALWFRVLECGIEMGIIDPLGLAFDFSLDIGEKKEWNVAVPEPYTCLCPWLEVQADVEKVVMSFIYNPKVIMAKKKIEVRIPEYFIERNSPLVNYRIPTERQSKLIMFIPKWGFRLTVENQNPEFSSEDIYIYCPYFSINEKLAVNLYFSVLGKPEEFLKILMQGKTVEEAIKIVLEEKGLKI